MSSPEGFVPPPPPSELPKGAPEPSGDLSQPPQIYTEQQSQLESEPGDLGILAPNTLSPNPQSTQPENERTQSAQTDADEPTDPSKSELDRLRQELYKATAKANSAEQQRIQAKIDAARNEGLVEGLIEIVNVAREGVEAVKQTAATSGGGGGVGRVPTARESALESRKVEEEFKTKGEAQYGRDNALDDKYLNKLGRNYSRKKEDLQSSDIKDQLKAEQEALQAIADSLITDSSATPGISSLDKIEFKGKETEIVLPNASLTLSAKGDVMARTLAYDLIDALGQRAGEAFVLWTIDTVKGTKGISKTEAEKIWTECAQTAAQLFAEVLYPIGDKAREAFNAKNILLRDSDTDPYIDEAEYKADAITKAASRFYTVARSTYAKEAFEKTTLHKLIHPEETDSNFDKVEDEKEKVAASPESVAARFKDESIGRVDNEKAKWSRDNKIVYGAGVIATLFVSGLTAVDIIPSDVPAWGFAAGSALGGVVKQTQSALTIKRRKLAEAHKKMDKIEAYITQDAGEIKTVAKSGAEMAKAMQPKYPEKPKPYSNKNEKRKYLPVIRLRQAKALGMFTGTVLSLAAIGISPEADNGASSGDSEFIDGFREGNTVNPLDADEGTYENDTQPTQEEQRQVQELLSENPNLNFTAALRQIRNGR